MELLQKLVRANALLLQGVYQGAENLLDSAIVDVRALLEENARLRNQIEMRKRLQKTAEDGRSSLLREMSELLNENDRLRAEIDAANSQPICEVVQINQDRYLSLVCVGAVKPKVGDKLYARPIPAQQIEIGDGAVDSFEKFAATFDHESNAWLDMDSQQIFTSGYNRGFLAGRSVAQQSPAVAVPEWVLSAIKRNLCPADSCDFHGNQDPYLSGGCCKPELQNAISYLESLSPRITETAVAVPETISDQLENFICYLIDKEEGAIIAEETLHHQLAAFLSNEKYNKPSPRITEQDALKAVWSHGYETGHNDGIGCGHSLAPRCRHSGENEYDAGDVAALLNKLNKVNHE